MAGASHTSAHALFPIHPGQRSPLSQRQSLLTHVPAAAAPVPLLYWYQLTHSSWKTSVSAMPPISPGADGSTICSSHRSPREPAASAHPRSHWAPSPPWRDRTTLPHFTALVTACPPLPRTHGCTGTFLGARLAPLHPLHKDRGQTSRTADTPSHPTSPVQSPKPGVHPTQLEALRGFPSPEGCPVYPQTQLSFGHLPPLGKSPGITSLHLLQIWLLPAPSGAPYS